MTVEGRALDNNRPCHSDAGFLSVILRPKAEESKKKRGEPTPGGWSRFAIFVEKREKREKREESSILATHVFHCSLEQLYSIRSILPSRDEIMNVL